MSGMTKRLSIVEVSRPPKTTTAIGLCISLPGRVLLMMRGISARAEVSAVISMGLSLSTAPTVSVVRRGCSGYFSRRRW